MTMSAANLANTVLSTDLSSLKLFAQGSGTFTVAGVGGNSSASRILTIPHNYGSDNLMFQVSSNSGYLAGTILPWASNDGRLHMYAELDATNLYIIVNVSDSSGSGFPTFDMDYAYRILIP